MFNKDEIQLPDVNCAPDVFTYDNQLVAYGNSGLLTDTKTSLLSTNTQAIYNNPRVEDLFRPIQGPQHPLDAVHQRRRFKAGTNNLDGTRDEIPMLRNQDKNVLTGHVEKLSISKFDFENQYQRTHDKIIGVNSDATKRQQGEIAKIAPVPGGAVAKVSTEKKELVTNLKRIRKNDASMDDYLGPWAGFEGELERRLEVQEKAKIRDDELKEIAATQQAEKDRIQAEQNAEKVGWTPRDREEIACIANLPPINLEDLPGEADMSTFHGKSKIDWHGRSWLKEPSSKIVQAAKGKKRAKVQIDFRYVDDDPLLDGAVCYIPKKWAHTWSGHTMGIQAIRLFPSESAHLILSASMDASIKMWDYYNDRKCKMTYNGHEQAVRDVQFSHGGEKFYSASFDRKIHLWDTERGRIISSFTNHKIPYCLTVHPDEDKQNIFLVGSQNKNIVQFDANSGQIVVEYKEHMGPVNTVMFVDENRKIATTGDDKKILIWNYGINVVDHYISDPQMHSIPATTMHPSKKYFTGQSMDNTMVTYTAQGSIRYVSRKKFKGHMNAGYAIKPGFSTDGRYIMSGDVDGRIHFWDWDKCKIYRTLKAHDSVCIDCLWHPKQNSRVITAGWDGNIKLWE